MSSLRPYSFGELLTFTRASVGTYCNSSGVLASAAVDSPRIEYDSITLKAKGLLIEEARTNLTLQSQTFDNASWSKTNVTVTADQVTAPDGTLTGDKIAATATSATTLKQAMTLASTKGAASIWIRQGNLSSNTFWLRNETTAATLVTAVVTWATGTVSGAGATLERWGTAGWYKLTMIATAGITSGNSVAIYPGFTGVSQTAGDYLYVWGGQLEAGAFATSYIVTTTATVTRSRDVCTMTSLGEWFLEDTATLFVEYSVPWAYNAADTSLVRRLVQIDDGTASNRQAALISSGAAAALTDLSTVSQASLTKAAIAASTVVRQAYAWAANDFSFTSDGARPGTDTAGTPPTGLTTFRLGASSAAGDELCGHLRKIQVYPRRLTDNELVTLVAA